MSKFFDVILDFSTKRVELFGAQYRAYGILGLLNFPIAYFILHDAMKQTNESLGLRLIAAVLCFPLIFNQYLPSKVKKYLPIYWHLVLLYSLPFFCTYMLLRNNFALEWLTNASLALFLFILLVDWLVFLICVLLGSALGIIVYAITTGFSNLHIQATIDDLYLACNQYSFIVIVGIFFSRHKEIVKLKERVHSMESLAATIAHELRTPLASLSMVGESMKKCLSIIEKWQPKDSDHDTQKILALLTTVPNRIHTTTRNAFTVIDMILMNLKKPTALTYTQCRISKCVELMLNEYPLNEAERSLIHWNPADDFVFIGNELYVKHIFFNLLKNALYHIKAANKGAIYIWQEQGQKFNYLYFKDTSQGIPFLALHHIFDSFYSRTARGTGIGLAFCKSTMLNFCGDITCTSQEGEFTTFKLAFPVFDAR